MEKITLEITKEELTFLEGLAREQKTSVNEILTSFVADISSSARRGGSDESMMAWQWFERNEDIRWGGNDE